MRKLKFSYLPIKQIEVPLPVHRKTYKEKLNVSQWLRVLLPEKYNYFKYKSQSELYVNLVPDGPFGPDYDVLIPLLFSDFTLAVQKMKKSAEFKNIFLINNHSFQADSLFILSIFEFYKLYNAIMTGEIPDSFLVSVFISQDELYSFLLPAGLELQKLVTLHKKLENFVRENPQTGFINPVTKKSFSIKTDTISAETSVLCFTESGYQLLPDNNFLSAFPNYNKKFILSKKQKPHHNSISCINCLACAEYCPAGLYPNYLYHYLMNNKADDAARLRMESCIHCGYCSLVCPSELPLTEKIKTGIDENY